MSGSGIIYEMDGYEQDQSESLGSSDAVEVKDPESVDVGSRRRSRSRSYCFTCYGISGDAVDGILSSLISAGARYAIIGQEICPTTQRAHSQGFVYFRHPKDFVSVRRDLPAGAHVERCAGSVTQNVLYCKKDGCWKELGTPPATQQKKGDLEKERWSQARTAAMTGDWDSVPDDIFIRCYGALKNIYKDFQVTPADAESCTGVWIYGVAGCGKSRYARENYSPYYTKNVNKWWDNYQHQPNVIIDDWSPDHKMLSYHLKIWADRYAFQAEIKGGSIMIRPGKIVVTSQYSIESCFEDEETVEAIRRRFLVINGNFFFRQ